MINLDEQTDSVGAQLRLRRVKLNPTQSDVAQAHVTDIRAYTNALAPRYMKGLQAKGTEAAI